jgi:hypothetical protein
MLTNTLPWTSKSEMVRSLKKGASVLVLLNITFLCKCKDKLSEHQILSFVSLRAHGGSAHLPPGGWVWLNHPHHFHCYCSSARSHQGSQRTEGLLCFSPEVSKGSSRRKLWQNRRLVFSETNARLTPSSLSRFLVFLVQRRLNQKTQKGWKLPAPFSVREPKLAEVLLSGDWGQNMRRKERLDTCG